MRSFFLRQTVCQKILQGFLNELHLLAFATLVQFDIFLLYEIGNDHGALCASRVRRNGETGAAFGATLAYAVGNRRSQIDNYAVLEKRRQKNGFVFRRVFQAHNYVGSQLLAVQTFRMLGDQPLHVLIPVDAS